MTDNPNTPREGKQIPLKAATKAQLRDFLTELGGKCTNFDDEQRLKEKIYGMNWDKPFITVYDDDPRSAVEEDISTPLKAKVGPLREVKEPMVEIMIHQQTGESGKRPVFAGVNGVGILLPRMKPILVKHRYYAVLRNAIERQYEYNEEAKQIEHADVPSYPFEVIRMPPDAELQAWSDYKAAKQAQDVAQSRTNINRQHVAA